MCCLVIVVIFMGLRRAYRLVGDFKVMIWETSHKGIGPFLKEELKKMLIWQLDEMVKK